MIRVRKFGKTADGRDVLAFDLRDGSNEATILNLGGIVQSLKIADRSGRQIDVVLGYNDVAGYENNRGYLGAVIGRYANRIERGRFEIDGKPVQLNCNKNGNHQHGGNVGFNKKLWSYVFDGPTGDALALSMISPDGDENYPGTLRVEVMYTLADGELKIQYGAVSDKKTIINLTNHSYFNLDGEGSGNVLDTFLTIKADRITPTDENLVPHGEFRDVAGTPFDFLTPHRIGERIRDTDDQDIRYQGGYDCNYVFSKGKNEYAKVAEAESENSGLCMEVYTDLPAAQFYTGNGLSMNGKSGFYNRNYGFAFETQYIPNSVNCPQYLQLGSPYYERGRFYTSTTAFKFTVK